MLRLKSSPTAHRPSGEPFTCQSPLPLGVWPMMPISLVRRFTIPNPVGFSLVPEGPHAASCPGLAPLTGVPGAIVVFVPGIFLCPIIAIATSSFVITASCVIHSYSDSGYNERNPVPSAITTQVRCGALPPVSQQKTISPATQGLVCTCPIWKGTETMYFSSAVFIFMLINPAGPAPIFRGPNAFSILASAGKCLAASTRPTLK